MEHFLKILDKSIDFLGFYMHIARVSFLWATLYIISNHFLPIPAIPKNDQ